MKWSKKYSGRYKWRKIEALIARNELALVQSSGLPLPWFSVLVLAAAAIAAAQWRGSSTDLSRARAFSRNSLSFSLFHYSPSPPPLSLFFIPSFFLSSFLFHKSFPFTFLRSSVKRGILAELGHRLLTRDVEIPLNFFRGGFNGAPCDFLFFHYLIPFSFSSRFYPSSPYLLF